MRNIDSATDFVLAYRKEMPVTGYMQRMIDMLMAHGRECEKDVYKRQMQSGR